MATTRPPHWLPRVARGAGSAPASQVLAPGYSFGPRASPPGPDWRWSPASLARRHSRWLCVCTVRRPVRPAWARVFVHRQSLTHSAPAERGEPNFHAANRRPANRHPSRRPPTALLPTRPAVHPSAVRSACGSQSASAGPRAPKLTRTTTTTGAPTATTAPTATNSTETTRIPAGRN